MKLALLKNRQRTVTAVDISANAVKLLELSLANKQYYLKNHAMLSLPSGSLVDGIIQNQAVVAQTLVEALKMAGIESPWIAAALPVSAVIEKVIKINNSEDIMQKLQLEIQRYVPYATDEMAMDFHFLNEDEALVVATRQQCVENLTDTLKMAGLSAKLVDVQTLALATAMLFIAKEQSISQETPLGCLHLEGDTLYFFVLENEKRIYSLHKNLATHADCSQQLHYVLEQYEAIAQLPIETLIFSGDWKERSVDINRTLHFAKPFFAELGEGGVNMMTCCGLAIHGLQNGHLY